MDPELWNIINHNILLSCLRCIMTLQCFSIHSELLLMSNFPICSVLKQNPEVRVILQTGYIF